MVRKNLPHVECDHCERVLPVELAKNAEWLQWPPQHICERCKVLPFRDVMESLLKKRSLGHTQTVPIETLLFGGGDEGARITRP